MTSTSNLRSTSTVADQLLAWDHVEWWVGNARAVTAWLCAGFGFHVSAYAGPETGLRDRVSYLLEQGDIRFLITAGLAADSDVAQYVLEHGDGVRRLAWRVEDPESVVAMAESRGAAVIAEPSTVQCEGGSVTTATIVAYGNIQLVFVDRSMHNGLWAPYFSHERLPPAPPWATPGLDSIDHVVTNVEEGRLDEWVAWYEEVLGFSQMLHFDAEQISTQYSALRSTVVHNWSGIVMPINEPAPGLKKSQIAEFLDFYGGPGVQHIAMRTQDAIAAVDALSHRGVRFLHLQSTYYEDARERCGEFDLPWTHLEELGIEVDKDSGGYLLQIFSEMITDRPTLFLEVIQREGATGFGEGNFKALFEAIERDQARRGNL